MDRRNLCIAFVYLFPETSSREEKKGRSEREKEQR